MPGLGRANPANGDFTQRIKIIKTYYKNGNCRWNKIFFSAEEHFTIGGYINKQNCRICGYENSQVIEERPLHLEKGHCWRAFWTEGEIIPFILRKRRWNDCNRQFGALWFMLLENMWLQQDGTLLARFLDRR